MSYLYNDKRFQLVILSLFSAVFLVGEVPFLFAQEANPSKAESVSDAVPEAVEETSSKDLELIDFANGLFQRNFYDMALDEYKKFVALYPQSAYLDDAYFGIAESLFFLKSYPKAIGAYNSYLEFYPQGEKKVIANLRLAQCLFNTKAFEPALKNLQEVDTKQLNQDFVEVYYFYQGKIFARLNRRKEAQAALNKVIALSSQGDYPFLALVELAELAKSAEDYIKAIEYYQKAHDFTKDKERKAITLYKQGEIYLIIKRHKEAIATFKSVLSRYPESGISFDAFSNLLIALYNHEQYAEVLKEYAQREKDFKARPVEQVFKLYYIVATAQVQLKNYIGALEILDEALALEGLETGNMHKALIKKTEILIKIRKFDIALSIINDQLGENTVEQDNVVFLKAEALYGLEQYAEAFDTYKIISEKYKDSLLKDDALYSMAHAKSKIKEFAEASNLFWQYYQTGKDERKKEEALYNLILIQNDLNNLNKTIEYAEIFIANFPKSPNKEKVLFLLGTLYQKNKQFDKAIRINKEYIAAYPQSDRLDEAIFLLAFNLQSIQKWEESLTYYNKLNVKGMNRNLRYPALKNSALIYISQDNNDMAAKTFNDIIALYEDNDLQLDTYLWLAEYFYAKKEFASMLKIVETIEMKRNEENKQKLSELIFFKAQAQRELRQIPKAIENYKTIIRNEEDVLYKAASHIGLGLCYVQKKLYKEAKKEFETAILENTEDNTITMRARFEIANMYWELKQYEDAVKFYMFVSVLYDDEQYCAEALYKAGQSFEAVHKDHEAIKVYDELGIRYPNSPYNKKALERIKALDEI